MAGPAYFGLDWTTDQPDYVWTNNTAIPEVFYYGDYYNYIVGEVADPYYAAMITEGTKGRLFEVTQDGEIVWDFLNPHVDDGSLGPTGRPIQDYSVFRAYRMPLFWGWPDSLTQ